MKNPDARSSLFMYYSFSTLTTTGYGDIVPARPLIADALLAGGGDWAAVPGGADRRRGLDAREPEDVVGGAGAAARARFALERSRSGFRAVKAELYYPRRKSAVRLATDRFAAIGRVCKRVM